MALARINTESFTEVINYHACDNVATRDCAVALSDFVAFTNQTNMTDYDILASSLGLVGCLATRKRMISRRVQKRPDMEQFHLSGTAFVKEDRENGKSGTEAVLCIRGTSHGPVSVRHKSVFYRKRGKESSWFLACELPSTRPTLC